VTSQGLTRRWLDSNQLMAAPICEDSSDIITQLSVRNSPLTGIKARRLKTWRFRTTAKSLRLSGGINVVDSKSNATLRTLEIEAGRFRAVVFLPVTKQLASGSTDGVVRVWLPIKSDQPELEFKHGPPVADVEFSDDGNLLLSASKKGAARIWNLETEELIAEVPTGEGENRDVSLSPNGHFVAVAKEDGRVRVTEVASMTVQHQFRPNPGLEVVAWSPDSKAVATGSYSGTIRIWSLEDGSLRFESGTGMGQIGDLEFVDDRVLSVVGTSGQLLLIDVNAGHEMRHLATHSLMHGVLDVSPDGRTLGVSGSEWTS
jgi:WD40 repeat protein